MHWYRGVSRTAVHTSKGTCRIWSAFSILLPGFAMVLRTWASTIGSPDSPPPPPRTYCTAPVRDLVKTQPPFWLVLRDYVTSLRSPTHISSTRGINMRLPSSVTCSPLSPVQALPQRVMFIHLPQWTRCTLLRITSVIALHYSIALSAVVLSTHQQRLFLVASYFKVSVKSKDDFCKVVNYR